MVRKLKCTKQSGVGNNLSCSATTFTLFTNKDNSVLKAECTKCGMMYTLATDKETEEGAHMSKAKDVFYISLHYPTPHVYRYVAGEVTFVDSIVPDTADATYRGSNRVHNVTSLTDIFIYRGMPYPDSLLLAKTIMQTVEKHHKFQLNLKRSLDCSKL